MTGVGRVAVVCVDHDLHAVRGQHFERRREGRLGQRVRVRARGRAGRRCPAARGSGRWPRLMARMCASLNVAGDASAAVAGRAERDPLLGIDGSGRVVVVGGEQALDVDEHVLVRKLAGARVDVHARVLPGNGRRQRCGRRRRGARRPRGQAAGRARGPFGGGPYNTARTLGRLEQPVHYLGCLSATASAAAARAARSRTACASTRWWTPTRRPRSRWPSSTPPGRPVPLLHRRHLGAGARARQALAALPPRSTCLHVGHARAHDGADGARAAGRGRGGRRSRRS